MNGSLQVRAQVSKNGRRVCRADQGAGPRSASGRGGIGAKLRYRGRRQVVSPSGSCFSEVAACVPTAAVCLWSYGGRWGRLSRLHNKLQGIMMLEVAFWCKRGHGWTYLLRAAQSPVNSFRCLRSVKHLGGWSEPHTLCYLKFLRFFGI